ncbi:MAG: alpha/beta hydrolase [Acidimicrobiaceae bacterium]|jgi:pimeloyl-ACP methyl ester carboxylesterase
MAISNVLLVHGAWHGAWCWAPLQQALDQLGIPSHAIDLPGHGISPLPLGDLHGDAAAVVEALEALPSDTLLIGHSYGGAVISQAAAHSDRIAHLMFIAAFALEAGESVNGFLRSAPRHKVELANIMVPTDEGATALDPEHAGALLYPGSSLVVQRANAKRLGPQPNATMTQEVDGAPVSAIESTYVLCNQDRAVHPEHQRIMAARCSSVIEIDSDHSPFVDEPATIASIIQEVVNA